MNRFLLACISVFIFFVFLSWTWTGSVEKTLELPSGKEKQPKATGLMLLKGDDEAIRDATEAIRSWTSSFNKHYNYPITIFHEDLTPLQMENLQSVSPAKIDFIPIEFSLPAWVDLNSHQADLSEFDEQFLYLGYRHMCRFFSGNVFMHPALASYDYYWRIDDDSTFPCPVSYDPFRFMQKHKKKYGWAIYFFEFPSISGDTLWEATHKYAKENHISTKGLDELSTITGRYHRCHFWNNFEIADLNFLRSAEYQNYFHYLDRMGGFYFYRWGDALVRTLAVRLLLSKDEVHHFVDVSYKHKDTCNSLTCPVNATDLNICPDGICRHCLPKEAYFRGVETWHALLLVGTLLVAVSFLFRSYWIPLLSQSHPKDK